MTTRKPLVLVSGFHSELPPGDLVPGIDTTAQASGNAALVLASSACETFSDPAKSSPIPITNCPTLEYCPFKIRTYQWTVF